MEKNNNSTNKTIKIEDFDLHILFPYGFEEENLLDQIWEIIERDNLTTYSSELQKTIIHLRLLAIIGLIKEFTHMAWDEYIEMNYYTWFTELELPLFHIAQLIGSKEYKDYTDAEAFYDDALTSLINDERRKIIELIIKGLGSEAMMFLEFWKATCPYTYVDEELGDKMIYDGEEEEDILNSVTTYKARAYDWITEGCYLI